MDAFAQLAMLGSSAVLMTGLAMLWRRGTAAHISAFTAQSVLLAATSAVVGYFGREPALYVVAAMFLVVKGLAIPWLLRKMDRRFQGAREAAPYVNTATSLIVGGLLVLVAYVVTRPLVAVSQLPTRAAMPFAMGLVFVSLFVLVSRRQALTQVIGFLMLENGVALLALLGAYGVPLVVEMGVFLDALMGFLVMQIAVYQIHDTFDSIDVDRLRELRR